MKFTYSSFKVLTYFIFIYFLGLSTLYAQESLKEEDFYRIMKVNSPEDVLLEVGGLVTLPNGDLGIATRRGDIFIVENPTSANPYFRRFAFGLHEILGLAYKDGAIYCAQRGELTKLTDTDNDGKADVFESVYSWPLSGNYHEYSFGPEIASDGSFYITTNLGFPNPWWHARSLAPWRGWTLRISEDGKLDPWATGMRSPSGLALIGDELFYTENQGDWVGSGGLWHVKKGIFSMHPQGLKWADSEMSPVSLKLEQFYEHLDPRYDTTSSGRSIKPANRMDEKITTLADMKEVFPEIQLPAVWLPHGVLGVSTTGIAKIPEGVFGPFENQILVGDQGQSKIMRVYLELVNGEYQGAAWDFRSGFQSGVLRMAWSKDGSLFLGQTNRGWGSAGVENEGLQKLVWNGQVPFEMHQINARPDGFEISFTKPIDIETARDIASYRIESFTYKYHAVYGSPTVNQIAHKVSGVKVAEDSMSVRLVIEGMRPSYIHKISMPGVRAIDNYYSLIHSDAYYTLNSIPEGELLDPYDMSTYNSIEERKRKEREATEESKARTQALALREQRQKQEEVKSVLSFDDVQPLLSKNTCLACHSSDKRLVGPSFKEIAKRGYSIKEISDLLKNPEPENWPDYSTPMPPMPQVPEEEIKKIARWISTLK